MAETYLNLTSYLSRPLAFQDNEEQEFRAGTLLLQKETGERLATKFWLGDQKYVIYGQPLVMVGYCHALDGVADLTTLKTRPVHFANTNNITQKGMKAFIAAWLHINGVTPDSIWQYELDLEGKIMTFRWLMYLRAVEIFDEDLRTGPVSRLLDDIIADLKRIIDQRATGELNPAMIDTVGAIKEMIIRSCSEEQGMYCKHLPVLVKIVALTNRERETLMGRFRSIIRDCTSNVSYHCAEQLEMYSMMLGIPIPESVMARMKPFGEPQPVTDEERTWIAKMMEAKAAQGSPRGTMQTQYVPVVQVPMPPAQVPTQAILQQVQSPVETERAALTQAPIMQYSPVAMQAPSTYGYSAP